MVQFIVGRLVIEKDETVRFAFALPISALYHFALRHPSARDQALPSDVFRIEDLHLDCWFLHECFQRRGQQSAADITDSGRAQARIPLLWDMPPKSSTKGKKKRQLADGAPPAPPKKEEDTPAYSDPDMPVPMPSERSHSRDDPRMSNIG